MFKNIFEKEKLPIKVKIRRWWKGYISETKYNGYIKPLLKELPYYYKANCLYWKIRHNTINKYHIIKTDLEPGYYDIDHRMEAAIFSLLCQYVEKEYDGIEGIVKRIQFLFVSSIEDKDVPPGEGYDYYKEIEALNDVVEIYKWYKEVYPKIEDNDPWNLRYEDIHKKQTMIHRTEPCNFDKDGDPTMWKLIDNDTPEEKAERRALLKESMEYQEKMEKEVNDKLITIINIRNFLWT